MSKEKEVSVTVIYPITFTLNIDRNKLNDDEYVESKQNEALDKADQYMQSSSPKPLIHDSDCPELID